MVLVYLSFQKRAKGKQKNTASHQAVASQMPAFFFPLPVSPLNRSSNQRPIGRTHWDRCHINTTMINHQTPPKNSPNIISSLNDAHKYMYTHNTVFDINHTNHNNNPQKRKCYLNTPPFANQINCPRTENKALVPMRHAFPMYQFAGWTGREVVEL